MSPQVDALVGAVSLMDIIVNRVEYAGEFTLLEAARKFRQLLSERADQRWMDRT